MSDDSCDTAAKPDESPVLQIVVHRDPESGLFTAQVHSLHPMIVKGYALSEVFKAIGDALAAQGALGRFASDIVVDFKYRHLRENAELLGAELLQFNIALARIADPDHPHGTVSTLDQARDLAYTAFGNARRAGRERRAAWRSGALAQTAASTDRDLLHALCGAVNGLLPLVPPDTAQEALGRLRAVLEACEGSSLQN